MRVADVGEHGVEGAEHRLRLDQPLLVAEQADVAVDERLLGVEVAGGDGDGRVPRLLHAHVLGLGRAGAEAGAAVDDLEVVHDVALRSVGHDLGDADLVLAGEAADLLVAGDDARQLVDPRQAQVANVLTHGRP